MVNLVIHHEAKEQREALLDHLLDNRTGYYHFALYHQSRKE